MPLWHAHCAHFYLFTCVTQLWRLSDGSIQNEYKGHREAIEACIFLPGYQEGPLVATASRDCSVRVWDMFTKGRTVVWNYCVCVCVFFFKELFNACFDSLVHLLERGGSGREREFVCECVCVHERLIMWHLYSLIKFFDIMGERVCVWESMYIYI